MGGVLAASLMICVGAAAPLTMESTSSAMMEGRDQADGRAEEQPVGRGGALSHAAAMTKEGEKHVLAARKLFRVRIRRWEGVC